jgi:predicted GTPase
VGSVAFQDDDADDERRDPLAALRDATDRAVRQTRGVAEWMELRLLDLVDGLKNDGADSRALPSDPEVAALRGLSQTVTREVATELLDLVHAQMKTIDHFTIAFFGRTHIGKSTTIEALVGGDGTTISTGKIDCTTDVREVDWASCRLLDTPGINGWGKKDMPRETLEERARTAVAEADLVILCFEDSGQHERDFAKVASWVVDFGKPAVALLNVKNHVWRKPVRVPLRVDRQGYSRSVTEHVGHIRQQLADTDLANIPVIAMSAHMAFAGSHVDTSRIGNPALAHTVESDIDRYGARALWEWSNLGAFTHLVVTALESDATGLRLNRLVRQVFGGLHRADVELYESVQRRAVVAAEPLEGLLRTTAELLGATAMWSTDPEQGRLRAALDDLAGYGVIISAPTRGSAQRFADNVIAARLTPLRAEAQRRADQAIDTAMLGRTQLTGEQLADLVYDTTALDDARTSIMTEVIDHLRQSIDLAVDDAIEDLEFGLRRAATVRGEAGEDLRGAGFGLALISLGASLIAIAAGPLGWLAAGAVGLASKMFGRRLRAKASSAHIQAETDARAQARRDVNAAFDEFESVLQDRVAALCHQAARGSAVTTAERAAELRGIARDVGVLRSKVAQVRTQLQDQVRLSDLDRQPSAPDILATAAQDCEHQAGLGGPALWLGEQWIDDPLGMSDHARPSIRDSDRIAGRRPAAPSAPAPWTLRRPRPRAGSGREWLAEVENDLGDQADFAEALGEIRALASARMPRVVVCGDYDTGKSSFIRRLLVDGGYQVPPGLAIRGDPTTSTAVTYEWRDILLVDTPGFQSGVCEHDEIAARELADAAAVLYLLTSNLSTGGRGSLASVLTGDHDRATPPKADRALFVVNRIDRLGADPVADPDGFLQLVDRKRVELEGLLVTHGAPQAAAQVYCVASDPFQVAGSRTQLDPTVFDEHRDWDGFDILQGALDSLRSVVAVNGVDTSLLHGGLARLATWRGQLDTHHREIAHRRRELRGMRAALERRIDAGRALASDRHGQLLMRLDGFTAALVEAAIQEPDPQRRADKGQQIAELGQNGELLEIVAEWSRVTADHVAAWHAETHLALDRRTQRESFRAALGNAGVNAPLFDQETDRLRRTAVGELTTLIGKVAAEAGRSRAAAVAAETVAKGARVARFGAFLQAGVAMWDLVELGREVWQERAREEEQVSLRKKVAELAESMAGRCVEADSSLGNLTHVVAQCERSCAELAASADAETVRSNATQDLIARCEEHMRNARRRLRIKEETHVGG